MGLSKFCVKSLVSFIIKSFSRYVIYFSCLCAVSITASYLHSYLFPPFPALSHETIAAGGSTQPFTDPTVMPFTKYFWANG